MLVLDIRFIEDCQRTDESWVCGYQKWFIMNAGVKHKGSGAEGEL